MRSAADFAKEVLELIGGAHVTNCAPLRERCERELEAEASVPHACDPKGLHCAIRSDDAGFAGLLCAPSAEALNARCLLFAPGVNDDTLIGSAEECAAAVRLLSGICGMAGCSVVEVEKAGRVNGEELTVKSSEGAEGGAA